MNGGLDYAMIVFSGHGYAERDGEPMFELSENEVISLSGICSFLPAQKMLMIADSCQGIIKLNEGGRLQVPAIFPQFPILTDAGDVEKFLIKN